MAALDKNDWTVLREALAATLDNTNDWLKQQHPNSGLCLELVTKATARAVAQTFQAPEIERLTHWDWEQLYFRQVQHQKHMWMFAITQQGKYGAACLGTINIAADYISIDYLERHPDADALKRLTALIAIQYVQALATYLELPSVRINDPDPRLLAYYEDTFGFVRHQPSGAVPYLHKAIES